MTEIERYWNDAKYRKVIDQETAHERKLMKDAWDQRLIALGIRWPNNWTDAEKNEANKSQN